MKNINIKEPIINQMRRELVEGTFIPALSIYNDEDDGMYLMKISENETCISYTVVKCIYAYGLKKNTIAFKQE